MFFPWCCGAGKDGIFRWRRPPERRQELCLADCLEQLSALLALPQIPGEEGPQGFRMLEDLHRLLRDVHIQVERAMSQRSANGEGGSVGSRCNGGPCLGAGVGDISALRDGCGCRDVESLCMRCGRVPAALCVTCAQDSSSIVGTFPVIGGLRTGCLESTPDKCGATPNGGCATASGSGDGAAGRHRHRGQRGCGWASQGLRNPCRVRPHRPRLRCPPAVAAAPLALTSMAAEAAEAADASEVNLLSQNGNATGSRHDRKAEPQQFYIGDDEAWRCDDPADTLPLVTGVNWRSEPGLPAPSSAAEKIPGGPSSSKRAEKLKVTPTLWGKQAGPRRQEAEEDYNPAERAQTVAQIRRQLHGLSEHSRHLLTVPLSAHATDRGSSSAGGTFRELLHACTSEDMVLFPPSCLEARRRLPEAPAAEAKGEADKDIDADVACVPPPPVQLPIPPVVVHDDDEDADCERYAVSRQRDGRLVWQPEPLPAG